MHNMRTKKSKFDLILVLVFLQSSTNGDLYSVYQQDFSSVSYLEKIDFFLLKSNCKHLVFLLFKLQWKTNLFLFPFIVTRNFFVVDTQILTSTQRKMELLYHLIFSGFLNLAMIWIQSNMWVIEMKICVVPLSIQMHQQLQQILLSSPMVWLLEVLQMETTF